MKKSVKMLLAVVVLFSMACSSTFKMTDKEHKVKGNKLAVIAGSFDEATKKYAQVLDNKFEANSKFKIISQNKIKRILGSYPIKIKGPYTSAYGENVKTDTNNTDKDTILKMCKKINSHYAYAIWIPSGVEYDENLNFAVVVSQMFDCASKKEIGQGKYKLMWVKGSYIGGGAARTLEEAMEMYSKVDVKNISKQMGMLKEKNK